MKLSKLYEGYPDIEIKDVKINSKECTDGDIFVCVKGVNADRHDYVLDAIKNGCSAIVASRKIDVSVPVIYVNDTNKELPLLANKLYNYPLNNLSLIGVTGTNGKTTVSEIIKDLMGSICAYMGTNGIRSDNINEHIRNTTPDSDRLFKYFDLFVKDNCKYVSMETSSEAFYRHRLDTLKFKVGILTNITEDHLNIHKTIENYVECKKQLFKQVSEDGFSILNKDSKYFQEFKDISNGKVLTYGKENCDLEIVKVDYYLTKTEIAFKYLDKVYFVTSPLVGEFNVYNLMAAFLCLLALNYSINDILYNVKNIHVPHGRCELLNYGQNYNIILDYAHTTDAFNNIYEFLNTVKKAKIITVSGSAGGREKEKRPLMGKVILNNSDLVIFTMDDPRFEDVDSIIDDLISESNKDNYLRIKDRKEAIYKALEIADKDDIVLIAGKGIDNYMAINDEYLPYSDLDTINSYFEKETNI